MGYKGRDVQISLIRDGLCLVGACDSCGAVGSKAEDQLKVPAALVGQFTARVALLELIAVNARPGIMTVAIASEPDPTGREILEGIRQTLSAAGYAGLPLVVSTEKNFTTCQTGLGIGVTGTCGIANLRIAGSLPGDQLFCLGLPRVGPEVTRAPESDIPGAAHIRALLDTDGIHDVVPVGSRGILVESKDLARHCNTWFIPEPVPELDLHKSGGPSTCAVFTADGRWQPESAAPALSRLPLFRIGRLTASEHK